jgi:RND family efflux transporter MFP subunit
MIQKLADSRLIDWIRRGRSLITLNRARTLLVLAGIIAAAMMVRMPYKIRCNTELQPVLRRYVAAPFTGPLEECRVEPGDLVQKDQLLARMDGREIRWELAGVQADLNKATKERNTHLNTHEFGSAAIARHEMQRLQNRTELLQHRDSSLEIRSPIDGIVVSGDHRQAEGVPLEQGQTLFEIAPLEKMIVELGIPEEDIRHVRAGQKVHLWLDAFPERVFEASLDQIRPRAELRENQNIFIAELQLANDDLQLRPGMRGTARVISDSHMLGWNLFHKPVAHVLGWLGW